MIENEQTIIIGFIGEQEVGKSTLIKKYFHKTTPSEYNPTIAVEVSYSSYQCDEGTILRVKCWDTSGQNKYKGMVCYHLKQADIIVIMFDITNQASFTKVDEWVKRMKNEKVEPKVLCLVGSKLDLVSMDKNLRKVSKKQGEEKAKEFNAMYVEISAKDQTKFQFLNDAFEEVLTSRAVDFIEVKKIKTNLDDEAIKMIDKNTVSQASCQCVIF